MAAGPGGARPRRLAAVLDRGMVRGPCGAVRGLEGPTSPSGRRVLTMGRLRGGPDLGPDRVIRPAAGPAAAGRVNRGCPRGSGWMFLGTGSCPASEAAGPGTEAHGQPGAVLAGGRDLGSLPGRGRGGGQTLRPAGAGDRRRIRHGDRGRAGALRAVAAGGLVRADGPRGRDRAWAVDLAGRAGRSPAERDGRPAGVPASSADRAGTQPLLRRAPLRGGHRAA